MSASPVELRWSLPIACPVEVVWPLLADTDRFNRAVGLPIRFTEQPGPQGTVRRGELRRFGLRVQWEEPPFVFRAPHGFTHERVHDSGPIARIRVEAALVPTDTGCRLDYDVTLVPRSAWLRPLIALEVATGTRSGLDRALTELVKLAEGRPHAYDHPVPPLDPRAAQALEAGLAGIEPAAVAQALRARIAHAPLLAQQRIRPLALAAELGTDPDRTVRACLDAVRAGVLELRWELICPSCRAPKAGGPRLDLAPGAVHCPSCDIHFDGSFPDAVEVVFRPAPQVREVEVQVACLLSPARTPHVLAQQAVEADAEHTWRLTLSEGGHRLDGPPGLGGASVEVRPGERARRIAVDLTPQGLQPPVLRVGPGQVEIAVRNRTGQRAHVRLERRERPPDTLTAGRLFELPDAQDLLPPDAVAPGLQVQVRQGWAVAVGQVCTPLGATADWELEGDAAANGVLLRTFDTLAQALEFVEPLAGDPAVAVGLAAGPVVLLADARSATPSGRAVDAALDAMRAVGGGQVAVAPGSVPALAGLDPRATLDPPSSSPDRPRQLRFATAERARAQRLAHPRPDPDPLPAVIDGYTLTGELGRGAMGQVLAAQAPDGTEVVLKLLLPDLARDPEHAQRLYDEARLARRLRHPNVVAVRDHGTAPNGRTYLVMERLRGGELSELLRAGPLDPAQALALGAGVLRGLHAAHAAGVIHRDVKPSNVFVLDDGTPKLIDFGIARSLDQPDALAARGVVLGSPRYMAPEQVACAPLDGRADVYSASLVLFECLTGAPAFPGEDPLTVARARLSAPPPSPRALRPELPAAVDAALKRGLARDPDARYPSAEAMADALDALDLR